MNVVCQPAAQVGSPTEVNLCPDPSFHEDPNERVAPRKKSFFRIWGMKRTFKGDQLYP